MTTSSSGQTCPPERLSEVLQKLQTDEERGLSALEDLLRSFPQDPQLHFLRGSLLAGARRYADAIAAMAQALAIAPDYPIARYQLGFLQLSSGDATSAIATWAPLQALADDHPLRLFSHGLTHMARDEFDPAKALLARGLTLNLDNAPLSHDIRLIIDRLDELAQGGDEAVSSTHLLLQQQSTKRTMH